MCIAGCSPFDPQTGAVNHCTETDSSVVYPSGLEPLAASSGWQCGDGGPDASKEAARDAASMDGGREASSKDSDPEDAAGDGWNPD
jgi:hypothetical protein